MDVKTLEFPNDPAGQESKKKAVVDMASRGYRVVSETIKDGSNDGAKMACGLALCCWPLAPFGLLAGKKTGTIIVTFQKD